MPGEKQTLAAVDLGSLFVSESTTQARIWPLYVLFFLSGVAGLVYEVMWTRSFSLVFGSTTRAAAAVLAAFFAGMALGNFLGGRLATRRAAAILQYAVAELLVAIGAVLAVLLIAVYHGCYPAIYQSDWARHWGLTPIRLLLALVALLLPCLGMGATLPFMSRAIVDRAGHVGRRAASVYAVNTIGATLGVLMAGFFLPLWLGVKHSVYLAAAVNVLVAGLALAMWRHRRRDDLGRPAACGSDGDDESVSSASASADLARKPVESACLRPENRLILFAAAVSGFGTLSLEVLYTRLLMTESDFSVYSFAAMLAVFLVFLALGSVIVSRIVDRLARPWIFLAVALSLAAVLIIFSPQVFRWAMAWHRPRGSMLLHLAQLLLLTPAVLGPSVLLIGTVLPTTWRIAARRASEVGHCVGRLTAVNTLAAVAGSVFTGFLVIPQVGVGRGFVMIAIVYAVLAMSCWHRAWARSRVRHAGIVALLLLVAPYCLRSWAVGISREYADRKLVSFREGEGGTVAVFESGPGERQMVVNNHYILGGSDPTAAAVQFWQGQLPLKLHPAPHDVAFIGVATGISVSSILEAPAVRHVLAMELIPGVVQAAADFEAANGKVLHDSRVRTIVADGRNHLFGTSEQFDVIVGDLFIPWEAGTGYLYTTEHFQSVARRLKDGGIFAQWFPSYQLSLEEFRCITATFMDVFPNAVLWINEAYPKSTLVALVASKTGQEMPETCRYRADWSARGLRCIQESAALRRWSRSAPRNTDDRPLIEFWAGATHFALMRHPDEQFIKTLRQLRDDE